jgi:hypothetical protein
MNAYSIFVGKPVGKRPFGRARRRWEDIRINSKGNMVEVCELDLTGSE